MVVNGSPTNKRPAVLGAMSELLVAAELLSLGIYVFRALVPTCPVDLVAYDENRKLMVRIEVKTAHWPVGADRPKCSIVEHEMKRSDVLALSTEAGVFYHPTSSKGTEFLSVLETGKIVQRPKAQVG